MRGSTLRLAAIEGSEAYLVKLSTPGPVDAGLALAYAAHRVLSDIFEAQKDDFDGILNTAIAAPSATAARTSAALRKARPQIACSFSVRKKRSITPLVWGW